MTPQEKNVFGKLFAKTELGTHKIDLALIDDLSKSLNKSKVSYKEFNDNYNKFADFRRLSILTGEEYSKDADVLINLYENAARQAKDLGLDFNSTQIAKEVRSLIASGDPSIIKKTINSIK
jgi:hypothetical protein